ncbi:MAG: sigma-70 family RNA polymerase sigma factor [Planctomycetes bacterium]|nr:sigma-70 family RNA polymerase sigma factor [Planctomycetota bacterium]
MTVPERLQPESSPAGAALKLRLANGDRAAVDALLTEHLAPLYAFVHFRVGGDRAPAEDIVQETFLIAVRDLARFDGRASFHAWLCGIARNTLRAERRKFRPVPLADALSGADPDIDAILMDVAREPLPDEVLERAETRDLVGATLSSLPPEYQRALTGKYVDGLSTAALAAREQKSAKAAESTLTRARNSFARVFELLAKRRGGLQ